MNATVRIPSGVYRRIRRCLLPRGMEVEEAGFIFAAVVTQNRHVRFEFRDWYHAQPGDFEIQSAGHIALNDEMRPRMIKRAHDLGCTIVEIHSHLGEKGAAFSSSDLYGFTEFVPHVRWRLGGKPYAAIVLTRSDVDSMAWHDGDTNPVQLSQIEVPWLFWRRRFRPTGATLRRCRDASCYSF